MRQIFNFTFSCLVIINLLILIFITPFVFFEYDSVPVRKGASLFLSVFLIAGLIYSSFRAYYYGLDVNLNIEQAIKHGGRISPGDKEFFAFFSKPIAFLLILFATIMQVLILKEIVFQFI